MEARPASAAPAAPPAPAGVGAGSTARWRGFGEPGDLEVDFGEPVLATLVTRLVAACRVDGGTEAAAREAAARALTLSGRIGALCEIVRRTEGAAPVALELRCPAAGCGEAFEVELPLEALAELGAAAEREPVVEVELGSGRRLRVRRPTGEDQRRWRGRAYASPGEAERQVLASLLEPIDGAVPIPDDTMVAAVSAAMAELDPLPDFRLASRCPACGEEGDHPLALEPLLAARLERRQRALMREVHRLASRYGWTEREVMALPAHRRRVYLEMLDAEAP